MLGFTAIGEAALGEYFVGGVVTVSWAAANIVLTATVLALVGVRVDLTTTYYVGHDPAIGEAAIGELLAINTLVLPPGVRLLSSLMSSAGATVSVAAKNLALTTISIEPITRPRRTTLQVLES